MTSIKGLNKEIKQLVDNKLTIGLVKEIYSHLLENITKRNGSFIPSRKKKRTRGIKWKTSWRNLTILRGLNSFEKAFAWKMCQDMLEVGSRDHRKGANKNCRKTLSGKDCGQLETLRHRLLHCGGVHSVKRNIRHQ